MRPRLLASILLLAAACSAPAAPSAPRAVANDAPAPTAAAPVDAAPAAPSLVASCGAPPTPGLTTAKVNLMLSGDDDWPVDEFKKLGPGAIPALAEVARAGTENYPRSRAISMLGAVGCRDVAPIVEEILEHDPDPTMRLPAARALGSLLGADATPTLIGALGDTDTGVVKFAIKTLGEDGDARAVDPLLRFRRSTPHKWLGDLAKQAVDQIKARKRPTK